MSFHIDGYRFGEIVINGEKYRHDVIIHTDRVQPNWWRQEGHSLSVEDIQEILSDPPEVLVIGTGASGRMRVPEATLSHLTGAGIEVIVQPTPQAVSTYNNLRPERRVAAALHLTC